MKKSSGALSFLLSTVGLLVLGSNCTPTVHEIPFDTNYTAPGDWKLVEDGKWGVRFNVPSSLREKGFSTKDLWVHENSALRVIVDFGRKFSPESLKRKRNYSQSRVRINGLSAVVCSYDQDIVGEGSLSKVIALYFLEKRSVLGAPYEPSYFVEYASENERGTALSVLQTVRFFES